MNRTLQPELLDELPADDPRAVQSRRDLRRINKIMGNADILRRFLNGVGLGKGNGPLVVVELGAGDGNIGLQLARSFPQGGRLVFVDKQPVVSESPEGWTCEVVKADVFDWLKSAGPADLIVANLFLHHFENETLAELLAGVARIARVFVATEPLRERFAPWFARKVWMVGCNEVTCHDAEISVKAGFCGDEISRLWPDQNEWQLTEKRGGIFTHFFGAARR